MTSPMLENVVTSLNYGDLAETWRVPKIEQFSSRKMLYDYQRSALENAAGLFIFTTGRQTKQNDKKEKQRFVSLIKPYLWRGSKIRVTR